MIKTDGRPTIAWADPTDVDPVYQILRQVRDKYESGAYRWVARGGAPEPTGKGGRHTVCVGMACAHTTPTGALAAYLDTKHSEAMFEAECYLALALPGDDNAVTDVYAWNDRLDSKSAKRSITRLLTRAMELRKKDL